MGEGGGCMARAEEGAWVDRGRGAGRWKGLWVGGCKSRMGWEGEKGVEWVERREGVGAALGRHDEPYSPGLCQGHVTLATTQ